MQVTSTKKEIWTVGSYSLLTLSIMVGFMYLNTFATEILKIDAGTLATALLVAKTIDFIVSLFAGVIIEKVKLGSKGKNQGWLYIGRWILAVCIAAEVFPTTTAPMWVRIAVLSVSYTILNSLMNLIQTAYYGVMGVIAGPNPANRSAMTVNMTRQGTVITLITSFIPTLAVSLHFGDWNYFIIAVVFMLPMPFALGNISKLADGKDAPVVKGSAAAGQISVKDMVDALVHNPMLLVLFLVNTLLNIATNIMSAQATYYWIYIAGDFSKMTVSSLVMAVVGFFAAMIMPKLGAKLGKKKSCCFGYLWYACAVFGMWLLGAKSYWFLIACTAIGAIGTYTYMPYAMLMYMDCGEWYLNKTGKDTRTIAMGLATPPMKIGMAVGGTIGLKLLAASGYVAGFTPDATWASSFMRNAYMIPATIIVCVGLIMIFGYRISDEDAARYAMENAARAAEGK